jgi:hypothetical protein
MKLVPFTKLVKPEHDGHRDWAVENPNIQIVDALDEADFIWFCAWGDGDALRNDIERGVRLGKRVIFNVTGDQNYVPDHGHHLYFNTTQNPDSTCFQIQVPYSYHEVLGWHMAGYRAPRCKSLLASFRGSFKTNPKRANLLAIAGHDIPIEECDGWDSARKGDSLAKKRHNQLLSESTFTLCPRGHGNSSIRVAEAIFHGSIPVLLDDDSQWFGQPMDFCVKYPLDGDMKELYLLLFDIVKTGDIAYRVAAMERFQEDYLLVDHRKGITGNIGYTEFIREWVKNV